MEESIQYVASPIGVRWTHAFLFASSSDAYLKRANWEFNNFKRKIVTLYSRFYENPSLSCSWLVDNWLIFRRETITWPWNRKAGEPCYYFNELYTLRVACDRWRDIIMRFINLGRGASDFRLVMWNFARSTSRDSSSTVIWRCWLETRDFQILIETRRALPVTSLN